MIQKPTALQVAAELEAWMDNMAASWTDDDNDVVKRLASAILRDIPSSCTHESAREARKNAERAIKFGLSEKGVLFLLGAQANLKDLMFWDDSITGESYRRTQRTIAARARKLDPAAVMRRYESLVRAGEKYGAVKSLAREFDVSSNTISRHINKAKKMTP